MFGQLKRSVLKAVLRPFRALLEQWLETRALQLPRDTREELAKRFGTSPETVDAINQALKTRAIEVFYKFWESHLK